MTDQDVEITTTRGVPSAEILEAVDRLANLLGDDWVVIISGSGLHLTVRPAPIDSAYIPGYGHALDRTGPQKPSEAPLAAANIESDHPVTDTADGRTA